MRRLFVAAALLAPGLALADPISVFAAVLTATGSAGIAAGAAAVTSFLATYGAVVGLVAVNVFGAVSGRRKARAAAARQRAEYNASLQDRSITALSANPPWRVVYGRCITGGDVVAIFTSDKTGIRSDGSTYTKADAYKHLVIVLASHQVQAIHEVYIDGVALGTLDGSGWVTSGDFYQSGVAAHRSVTIAPGGSANIGSVVTLLGAYSTTGLGLDTLYTPQTVTLSSGNTVINNPNGVAVDVEYTVATSSAKVRVSKHLGTDSQTVDTYLNGVLPSKWTSNHRLRGLAYIVVTLDLEEPRFQGGPPGITADVSGRLVYDPRTATTAWSSNNALCIRDFLMAPWGYSCDATDIDDALCIASANACDASISLDVGGVVTTGATYTCNGAFSSADSREAVLEDLCESMAGFATYGATWGIVAGSWTAPVMDLTDDDLDGQIEVAQAGAGLDAVFNGLRGQYIAAGKATPADFDSYQNATFVTADGEELWSDITLPFTDNKARARNLARVFVERARQGLVIRYPAKLRAWPLQIGDRVTVTSAEYGFSAKAFRVTDWQFGSTTAVQLVLQEDDATVYDLADAATADPAPNTGLPNPWAVGAIANLAAASSENTVLKSVLQPVIPRILVTWDAITDAYVADPAGVVEIYWKRPGGEWIQQNAPGDATSAYLTGVAHGEPTLIAARARNSLGAPGPFTYVYHVVYGLLASTGAGGNQLLNPCFMDKKTDGWSLTFSTLTGAVISTVDSWSGAFNLNGRETGYLYKPGSGGTDGQFVDATPGSHVASPDRWYQFSVWCDQYYSGVQLYCAFLDASGAQIGLAGVLSNTYSGLATDEPATARRQQPGIDGDGEFEASYAKLWFTAQAPAGTARIVPVVRMYQAPAAPYSYVFMTRAMLCEVTPNCDVLVPFDFGAGAFNALLQARTSEIAPNAATTPAELIGAGPYADSNSILGITVTLTETTTVVARFSGTMRCTNSSGAAKLIKCFASVFYGGTAYGTKNMTYAIANGEEWEVAFSAEVQLTLAAGSHTIYGRQSNHATLATINAEAVSVTNHVEAIKR